MSDERVVLTAAEAIAMLPDGDMIHTFRQASNGILFGADWKRNDMIKTLNKYEVEVTGEQAQAMNHGMALKDEYGWLFIETKKREESGE
jgi:hypothetical protein